MFNPKKLSTPAIIYGKTHEKVAIQKYEEMSGVQVAEMGLFIHPDHNFLAGTIHILHFPNILNFLL